ILHSVQNDKKIFIFNHAYIGGHNYFVYIATNINRTVLNICVTNDLERRMKEHEFDSKSVKRHFAGKYNAYFLVYWERFEYIDRAIDREKELKGWTRKKKEDLINSFNPQWNFLNDTV